MSLLKGDGTVPEKIQKGLGLSVNDGWYFGVGFGLALTVAVPIILIVAGLIIAIIFAIFGSIGI